MPWVWWLAGVQAVAAGVGGDIVGRAGRGAHQGWRCARATLSRRARGQAILEFALIAPLFFMLIFGLIEFALIESSVASFNFAAKDAARLGSLLGRTDSTADTQMLSDIQTRVNGVAISKILQVEIYKSDSTGAGPSTSEDLYTFGAGTFTPAGTNNWPANARDDTLINADYLGVRITYVYTYLTGFISGSGSQLQLTADSVQRIEPQDYQSRHRTPDHLSAAMFSAQVVRAASAASLRAVIAQVPFGPASVLLVQSDRWRTEPMPVASLEGARR